MSTPDRSAPGSTAAGVPAFQPYIPAHVHLPEFSPVPLLVGTVLGMVFGASSLYLVLKVGLTVKSGPRKCKGNQDLATLEANLEKNLACAAARDAINNKCFKGGDAGHREQANAARKAAANCIKWIAKKKADQPANPRAPNPQPVQP